MILTAHQPTYLPWLGLFHKIALSDQFVYLDNLQFEKNSWENRNKIKTSDGSMWLTIPVNAHINLKSNQTKIDYTHNWHEKHLKSIKTNYRKTPYFSDYITFFEDTYEKKWQFLSEINEHVLKWILRELGINVKFLRASDFDFQGAKSDLILDMCKKLGVKKYIFGLLGREYANIRDFKSNGIDLIFQNYNHPSYKQIYGNFIPNLSVIDLLFNCGPNSYSIIMSNNISKDKCEN